MQQVQQPQQQFHYTINTPPQKQRKNSISNSRKNSTSIPLQQQLTSSQKKQQKSNNNTILQPKIHKQKKQKNNKRRNNKKNKNKNYTVNNFSYNQTPQNHLPSAENFEICIEQDKNLKPPIDQNTINDMVRVNNKIQQQLNGQQQLQDQPYQNYDQTHNIQNQYSQQQQQNKNYSINYQQQNGYQQHNQNNYQQPLQTTQQYQQNINGQNNQILNSENNQNQNVIHQPQHILENPCQLKDCLINKYMGLCKYDHQILGKFYEQIYNSDQNLKFYENQFPKYYKMQKEECFKKFMQLQKSTIKQIQSKVVANWVYIDQQYLKQVINKLGATYKTDKSVFWGELQAEIQKLGQQHTENQQSQENQGWGNIKFRKKPQNKKVSKKIQNGISEVFNVIQSFGNQSEVQELFLKELQNSGLESLEEYYKPKCTFADKDIPQLHENHIKDQEGKACYVQNGDGFRKKIIKKGDVHNPNFYREDKENEVGELYYKIQNIKKNTDQQERQLLFSILESKYIYYNFSKEKILQIFVDKKMWDEAWTYYQRNMEFFSQRQNLYQVSSIQQKGQQYDLKIIPNPLLSEDQFVPAEILFFQNQQYITFEEVINFQDYNLSFEDLIFVKSTQSQEFQEAKNYIENLHNEAEKQNEEFEFNKNNELQIKRNWIGIDSEGYDTFLIQIATKDKLILIDIFEIGEENDDLYKFLEFIFNSKYLLKIGQAVYGDIKQIQQKIGCIDFKAQSILNIEEIFKKKKEGESKNSLAYICKTILGKELSKIDQQSNWKIRPLTKRQMHYGAMDAFIPLIALEKMIQMWGKQIVDEFIILNQNDRQKKNKKSKNNNQQQQQQQQKQQQQQNQVKQEFNAKKEDCDQEFQENNNGVQNGSKSYSINQQQQQNGNVSNGFVKQEYINSNMDLDDQQQQQQQNYQLNFNPKFKFGYKHHHYNQNRNYNLENQQQQQYNGYDQNNTNGQNNGQVYNNGFNIKNEYIPQQDDLNCYSENFNNNSQNNQNLNNLLQEDNHMLNQNPPYSNNSHSQHNFNNNGANNEYINPNINTPNFKFLRFNKTNKQQQQRKYSNQNNDSNNNGNYNESYTTYNSNNNHQF